MGSLHVRLALMLAINFELFGYISVHFGEVLIKFTFYNTISYIHFDVY